MDRSPLQNRENESNVIIKHKDRTFNEGAGSLNSMLLGKGSPAINPHAGMLLAGMIPRRSFT